MDVGVSGDPGRVVVGTGRALLEAAALAVHEVHGTGGWQRRRPGRGGEPLDADRLGDVDTDAVAQWMVGHYPGRTYPAVVVGSPHGGSVHLAAALGVPWLPAGFEVAVDWPGGSADDVLGALARGSRCADRILAGGTGVTVRQVHHPGRRASALTLVVRWCALPDPYRRFLSTSLAPGAPVLLVSDGRAWPVLDVDPRFGFQIGGAGTGLRPADFGRDSDLVAQMLRGAGGDWDLWDPPDGARSAEAEHAAAPGFDTALGDWARRGGHPMCRVRYPAPGALSAAVADIYRSWLRGSSKAADRCVISGGPLVAPWEVLRAGLVPYWCADSGRRCVADAECWLAGSRRFTSVDVLPEAPGLRLSGYAGLDQWRAIAWFGRRRGVVDGVAARGYPTTPVTPRHAAEVLRRIPSALPRLLPLPVATALDGLGPDRTGSGLLLS